MATVGETLISTGTSIARWYTIVDVTSGVNTLAVADTLDPGTITISDTNLLASGWTSVGLTTPGQPHLKPGQRVQYVTLPNVANQDSQLGDFGTYFVLGNAGTSDGCLWVKDSLFGDTWLGVADNDGRLLYLFIDPPNNTVG